ncbi:hypothetical protein MPK70_gp034 [Erwinia phage pEa_SNUABM_33]|uniref:Uncharacterized protein n=1 Tax=Erwinia phage pEa_SNUABM_33 TaxID=2869556 RepID=A0AAE8C019_9CAUD|nr:hypothetical protein MPK70_gp034 [Erwinia phage pEa_SNUABM_33]QZE57910.1 hypothetical protein pEaSNUABM33_00034 [Erwinia phage pEa_SNUABM_33]
MAPSSFTELRERLVKALDMSVVSDGPSACYVDATGNPMGLVSQWRPESAENILLVIERYGLHVERTVDPRHKPKPGEEDRIVWEFNVWSRNPIYRNLSQDYGRALQNGPRIVGPDLTTAVFTWAVLRAERVKQLRESKTEGKLYHFGALREKVYVSPAE